MRKPKHDQTLVDHVADVLTAAGIKVGKVDREKGTINILSKSTHSVHKLKFERV